jgi:hypothetical protein
MVCIVAKACREWFEVTVVFWRSTALRYGHKLPPSSHAVAHVKRVARVVTLGYLVRQAVRILANIEPGNLPDRVLIHERAASTRAAQPAYSAVGAEQLPPSSQAG